ncbi:MAG: FlgD immunoglobulin-like domain containing protein [Candidatus Eisenbacteria bacterium]
MYALRSLFTGTVVTTLVLLIPSSETSMAESHPEEIWKVQDGRITFHLDQDLLSRDGIEMKDVLEMSDDPNHPVPKSADPEWCVGGFRAGKVGQLDLTLLDVSAEAPGLSFDITEESDLTFRVQDGIFVPYGFVDGAIRAEGGVTFVAAETGAAWAMRDFALEYLHNPNDGPGGDPDPEFFRIVSDRAPQPLILSLRNTMTAFLAMESMLVLAHNDVVVSDEWAAAMGRPELAGRLLGGMQIYAIVEPTGPTSVPDVLIEPNFFDGEGGEYLDVALGFLDSIDEVGRLGEYPNGISGITMATTSCNKGTVDIPWEAPMDMDHPGIDMQLYRETDVGLYDKFEMVGYSDIKHGFFALSNSQCDPCVHWSDGSFLGVGCSDTYGAYNNSDRAWLAPRDEWNPYLGTWECLGSHFAGGEPDCIRRHASEGHNEIDHRLAVRDSDLANANSTYYYESMYVLPDDVFKMNNIGSKRCTMSWDGAGWAFDTPTTANDLVEGPAVLRWDADVHTWAQVGTDDGYVILSSQATDLGGGMYHYEYALFNFDSDRKIRSISIPVDMASVIENIEYHDGDLDPANDWTATEAGGLLTFETATYAENPDANALMFQFLFNFRFDADAPPVDMDVTLGVFKPGTPDVVAAASRAPGDASAVTDPAFATRLLYLHPSQPNPVEFESMIRFDLGRDARVRLDVFDSGGRRVHRLIDAQMEAGSHSTIWDGTDLAGRKLGSGVYYYLLTAGGETATQSVVLVE